MQLNNKSIVITGGTSGIGFQLVNKLSSSNQLFVIAKNQAKLTSLSEEIPNVTSIQADLSIPAEVVKASNTLTQLTNNIDLLINNAAIQHPETFLAKSFQYESIAKEVTVNFCQHMPTNLFVITSVIKRKLIHYRKRQLGIGISAKNNVCRVLRNKSRFKQF